MGDREEELCWLILNIDVTWSRVTGDASVLGVLLRAFLDWVN